jgi:prepilin-type N-terminal cleavage/methylation domain-containing protein
MSRRRGFTLIEILIVLTIMAILFAFAGGGFARSDGRVQAVKAAAEELASTCRLARSLATSRNATYAVVFHIQNHPQTSGRIINNRSGGHWYRIVGPQTGVVTNRGSSSRVLLMPTWVDNLPAVTGSPNGKVISSSPYNLAQMAAGINASWVDEQHRLPAGKVRFLALTDMDYGDFTYTATRRVASATISYPRPWFGWWDAGNVAGGGVGRFYPWGGYDPIIPGSGFYYWGRAASTPATAALDAQPIGSTHADARLLDRWIDGQQGESSSGGAPFESPAVPDGDVLYEAGTPRPLIDGTWRDMSIMFLSSGEVQWGGTMPGRHCWLYTNNISSPAWKRGAAERCNGVFTTGGIVKQHYESESGNFERDSGGFFVTLAPDVETDQDVFPTAKAALDSLMPAYRIFVSVLGEVRVIMVSRTAKLPVGTAPFPATESWWRTGTNMKTYFGQDRLVTGTVLDASSTGIGESLPHGPITDFLTTDMLTNRSVWIK